MFALPTAIYTLGPGLSDTDIKLMENLIYSITQFFHATVFHKFKNSNNFTIFLFQKVIAFNLVNLIYFRTNAIY
jgi:hypothetical protein